MFFEIFFSDVCCFKSSDISLELLESELKKAIAPKTSKTEENINNL